MVRGTQRQTQTGHTYTPQKVPSLGADSTTSSHTQPRNVATDIHTQGHTYRPQHSMQVHTDTHQDPDIRVVRVNLYQLRIRTLTKTQTQRTPRYLCTQVPHTSTKLPTGTPVGNGQMHPLAQMCTCRHPGTRWDTRVQKEHSP